MSNYNNPAYVIFLEKTIFTVSWLTGAYGSTANPIHKPGMNLIRLVKIITDNNTVGSLLLNENANANSCHATDSDRNTATNIWKTLTVLK